MASQEMELGQKHDELNLARLNLILAPNRTELREWTREIEVDALGRVKIACTALHKDVVPHGLDNDILLGLVNAAVLQGLPEDDTVRLTARELLVLSGISPSTRAYRDVKASLRRLQHSAFELTDSWYDGKTDRWRSVSFSLIAKFWEEDNARNIKNVGQWRAQTILAIKIDDGLIRNIRAGHIMPLDVEILSKLTQPMTRNLYRTLTFQRMAGKRPVAAYSVPLSTWAAHLGLPSKRLDSARRALETVHEELTHHHFLKSAEIEGRGKNAMVHYVFAAAHAIGANTESVTLLVKHGVADASALQYAQEYSPGEVQRAVSVLTALERTDYGRRIRNRPGLLIDILKNPPKYDSILMKEEAVESVIERSKGAKSKQGDALEEHKAIKRTINDAYVLLLNQFDDTNERRALRDQAAILYVAGEIKSLDLIELLGKNLAQATELVEKWKARVESE